MIYQSISFHVDYFQSKFQLQVTWEGWKTAKTRKKHWEEEKIIGFTLMKLARLPLTLAQVMNANLKYGLVNNCLCDHQSNVT